MHVQEFALGTSQQGATGIERMSAICKFGKQPQNMYRALRSLLGLPAGAPPFTWIELPMKYGRKVPHPVLLPHLLFSSFYKASESKLFEAILGGEDELRNGWQSLAHTDFVKRHPLLPKRLWDKIIPLGVHGDAGAFCKTDSLYALSWNSLLGRGSTVRKRFLFTILRNSDMLPETLDLALEVMAWSVYVLLGGISGC